MYDANTDENGDNRNDVEKLILSATKSLSSVLLPMIASLGELVIDNDDEESNESEIGKARVNVENVVSGAN